MSRLLFLCLVLLIGCKDEINKENSISPPNKQTLAFIIERYKQPADDYVMVVAHRGDWRNFPENSIEAIQSAIKLGVDMVEIDVRKTLDGAFVLMHDETIDRTTNGIGFVAEKTLEEIRSLRLMSAIGVSTDCLVPTLQEALLSCKGKIMVNLDKAEDYIRDIYPILVESGTLDQVVMKGHHTPEAFKEKFGELSDRFLYMPLITVKINDVSAYVKALEQSIDPTSYEVVFDKLDMESFAYIPTLKNNEDNVWINTLYPRLAAGRTDDKAYWDPDANWGWVIENGATIIQTDRPRELIEYLELVGKHNFF